MKVKHALLITGITSMMSVPVLAADVIKVYGQANLSMDSSSVTNGTTTNVVGRKEGVEVLSNASRFGMKGVLDSSLENTSVIYQLEAEFKASGINGDKQEDNMIYARESYAGLQSKAWGKVRIGRVTVGYKSSYTAIDPWTDHVLQARQSGQQGASNINANYFNNAVDYVSPKMNGFQFNAHYSTLSDDSATKDLHNAGKMADFKGGTVSGFGLKYSLGGLRLTADTPTVDSDSNPGKTDPKKVKNGSANQITAQYKFSSGTSLAALYEDVSDLRLGTNLFAVVTQKVGKNGLLTASYGVNQGGSDNVYSLSHNNEDATTIGLGAKYKLTKKSALILGWSKFERDAVDASTFTLGIDAKFGY